MMKMDGSMSVIEGALRSEVSQGRCFGGYDAEGCEW